MIEQSFERLQLYTIEGHSGIFLYTAESKELSLKLVMKMLPASVKSCTCTLLMINWQNRIILSFSLPPYQLKKLSKREEFHINDSLDYI